MAVLSNGQRPFEMCVLQSILKCIFVNSYRTFFTDPKLVRRPVTISVHHTQILYIRRGSKWTLVWNPLDWENANKATEYIQFVINWQYLSWSFYLMSSNIYCSLLSSIFMLLLESKMATFFYLILFYFPIFDASHSNLLKRKISKTQYFHVKSNNEERFDIMKELVFLHPQL